MLLRKHDKLAVTALAALLATSAAGAAWGAMLEFDFGAETFSDGTTVDNDYLPLSVLTVAVFFSEADDGCEVSESVYEDTVAAGFFDAPYDGTAAIVIRDREWVDEECTGDYVLVESTADWYAQDDDGKVWYLGEDTTAWDDENDCLTTGGAWKAGDDGAEAGVIMLADPEVGEAYQQEYYEGEAEDRAKVLRLDAPVSIDFGEYEGCLKTKEYTPLSPGEVEHKFYCRLSEGGVGLSLVNELKGKTRRVEYIGTALPAGDFPEDFPTSEACAE